MGCTFCFGTSRYTRPLFFTTLTLSHPPSTNSSMVSCVSFSCSKDDSSWSELKNTSFTIMRGLLTQLASPGGALNPPKPCGCNMTAIAQCAGPGNITLSRQITLKCTHQLLSRGLRLESRTIATRSPPPKKRGGNTHSCCCCKSYLS